MKICILCAVIIVLLTNDARADEQSDQNDARADEQSDQNILIKESTSVSTNFPSLRSYGKIIADDQPGHHPTNQGHIRFEDQSLERPIKFDPKEHGYIDNDKADPGSLLADISFDDDESFDQNNHISNAGPRYEVESNNAKGKIKFEGNTDDQENSIYQKDNDEEDYAQAGASQIVFEADGKADKDESDYSDVSEIEADTPDKPIKFENQDNKSNSNHKDSYRHPVTVRVVFKDDSYQNQQPVQNKKRKPRRKPEDYEAKPTNPAPRPPNSSYPGTGYPGYPGVGYPSPGYPGPGDPNTGYSGYPTPGYPAPGHPYPNYPSPYPSMAFPTPADPGHSSYPSIYAPMSPGYGVYSTPGYQVSGNRRPPASPTVYPTPSQSDPSGHTDTRYPSQEHAGFPAPGAPLSNAPQSGQAGPPYQYYQGYPVHGYPPPYPSDANSQYPPHDQAQYRPPVYPGVHQQGYQPQGPQRPSRRPKSLTQLAVSAVAEALTSIALYDDQQCVPRILCEVAGGSTPSSPTLLKASASLQPLLTLLQAYNGVSSSPLFIFGRAAVMGVTAKGNPSGCYRAYPKCPRDPEKLINYLNNHNGGFFRFFGQPETPQQPHNLEQFYNYLSGQNGLPQQPPQQGYGYPRPYGYGFPVQNPYAHPYNYGQNYYNEQNGYKNAKDIDNEVEGRIQNKPGENVIDADSDLTSSESQDEGSKWSFPEGGSTKKGNDRDRVKITKQSKRPPQAERQERPSRGSKTLKFPDNRSDDRREIQMLTNYPRKDKHIFFPRESHYQINTNYQTTTTVNPEEYYFDHKHNFYVRRPKALKTDDVVYVLRGNGDPYHPEIVRVKPGQSI